ncbi:hypothetical protein DPMN_168206, partial [Dreissena polymorpha]
PEPIYLPPEYSTAGNSYRAHLFSLGMTLLYAAEYNVDHNKEAISPELREILGRMTADDPALRPDLESTIILCEEQLCGQSSQEVCCGIAAVVGFGIPSEEHFDESIATETYPTGASPEEYSHAESFIVSEQGEATYCDDIPDLTEDISQVESLPLSEHETVVVTETSESQNDSMQLSEDSEMDRKTKTNASSLKSESVSNMSHMANFNPKPALPRKPDLNTVMNNSENGMSGKGESEVKVSELFSESDMSEQSKRLPEKKYSDRKHKMSSNSGSEVGRSESKTKERKSSSSCSTKQEMVKDSNQNITFLKHDDVRISKGGESVSGDVSVSSVKNELLTEPSGGKSRRNRRKQGLTITDILDALDRYLSEEELWALCKEGIAALQRKKKHLPAYLSPDTLVIRESGNLSFKAIPEEKPLETIFMAPELREKGELTEKTCMFGLSVTVRCAAGKKHGPVSSLGVGQALKDLLQYMTDPSSAKRPELVDVAKICNEHSKGVSSDGVCARLFQDAYNAMIEKENKAIQPQPKAKAAAVETRSTPPCTPSAFKPAGGASFQPIKPLAVGPTTGSFSSTGAFCPIPKKQDAKIDIGEPRIPTAFSSPATHFKPIILHQTSITANEKAPLSQEVVPAEKDVEKAVEATTSKLSSTTTPKKTQVSESQDASNDKEKEVVKKLKELKKNLMKHKQPSMVKEIENEDKPQDSKSSTPSKKSLPPTPKKSSSEKSEGRSKRRQTTGALEALIKEIQKQGTTPDTNSLAAAIASVLQNHLNLDDGAKKPQSVKTSEVPGQNTGDLDMTVTSAQASLGQNQALQNLNIPQQYHSQLLGQTMSLPMHQYAGNMALYSGLPQFQFQQDPVTGYLQLVPVNVVPMRPQSVHSNCGSVHSSREYASPTGSGTMIKDISSPDLSPKMYSTNHGEIGNASAISDSSNTRGKSTHGRTAKDLVQKTANLRAKNLGRPSPSNVQSVPLHMNGGLHKWKSDHALDRVETQFDSDKAKHASYSSLSFQNKLSAGFVYDDSMLNQSPYKHGQISRPASHYGNQGSQLRSPDENNRLNINSTTSSPSPSTHDSGIGGMNHGTYRGLGPVSDASLMERLLSNVNVKQQRVLGKVVHLLREVFAFDGYMENGVEDLAMAEYICSLGALKWETFKSAISEKYSDLYFQDELLCNLYAAVNSNQPSVSRHSSGGGQNRVPASHTLPKPRQRGNQDEDSSGHSECNEDQRKDTSQNRIQMQLSPSNGHLDNPRSPESDSTDSETYTKRRRVKTKHELDKMKSGHQLEINNIGGTNGVASNSELVNGTDETKPPRGPSSSSVSLPLTNLPNNTVSVMKQPVVDTKPPHPASTLPKNKRGSQIIEDSQTKNGKQSQIPNNDQHNSTQSQPTVNGVNGTLRSEVNVTGLSREISISSHSSCQSDLDREVTECIAMERKGHVVYHWAMIQLNMSQDMDRFMQDIDEQNSAMLTSRLSELDQQLKMEKRMRKKTQKFYKGRIEVNKMLIETSKNDKAAKGERNQILQVAKDITEMTKKINFLDLCKTHIQMLLAELQGIDVSYLHSITVCGPGQPLQLQPRPDNPLLQFQTIREPHSGCEIQALHAGTPEGLMAYLFASTALSDGYIHQFLFCFRYFTTAENVLNFLTSKYASATKILTFNIKKRSGSTEVNISRLQHRVIDLLLFWIEGYFSIDFKDRPALINSIREFVRDNIPEDSERGQSVMALLSNCISGHNLELSTSDPDESDMVFWQRTDKQKPSSMEKKKELITEESADLKTWDSFRSLVRGKTTGKEKGKVKISAVVVERRRKSNEMPMLAPLGKPVSRRTDMFMLADYSAQCLAEQLCLMEQTIFQATHPVHYLDSKAQGVGVALTMKGMRTPAPVRRSCVEEGFGLFVDPVRDNQAMQTMIDHAQEVTHWVATEIVSCSNPKMQLAILSKFLFIAYACMELRNFATSMAILDGLENLIVKQLPAWKNLPGKCSNIVQELNDKRMFLKNDPMSLMQQGKDCHLYPTIPSAVYFLLHIQQQEIGGFKLANQMFKWSKMRSISQVIDQIRLYREHTYGFDPEPSLQETLRQRMREMSTQDVQDLASQNEINYQKMSSSSGLSGALKKVRGKFHAK